MSFVSRTVPATIGRRADNVKLVAEGTHRVATIEETLARVQARSAVLGITRVADLTDIDVLGIPSAAAVCPALNWPPVRGCISVLSGKGISRAHARASALMEAAERWSARWRDEHTVVGSVAELAGRHAPVHPSRFIVPGSCDIDDDQRLEWVPARSLFDQNVVLIPAFMVYVPYSPGDPTLARAVESSNGLASGNTLAEAIVHGLYELIERDAEAIALHSGEARWLDLEPLRDDPELGPLLQRFTAAGLELVVKEISQDIEVPTFFALTVDPALPRMEYVNGGKGTHLDPRVALQRALTEVAQSRCVIMSGIREDMARQRTEVTAPDLEGLLAANNWWTTRTSDAPAVRLDEIDNRATDNIVDDLVLLVDLVRRAGLDDVIVADLTRPELGVPVARVCVPGLEFHAHGNWCGPRLTSRAERSVTC